MKNLFVSALAVCLCICTYAEDEKADTIEAQTLAEVTIAAPKVIRKADMDVYYPSVSAVENSKNGLQILSNLRIPQLLVNELQNKITSVGKDVQVRINGRVATIEEVQALMPETIKRVEWIDNPGLRYEGANAVLNVIVRNPEVGGSLMLDATQSVHSGWGTYLAGLNLNFGRSQFSIMGNGKLIADFNTSRDYYETITYPDGKSLTRRETPVDGKLDGSSVTGRLGYSYIKPDTTVVYVQFGSHCKVKSYSRFNGKMSLSDGSDDIFLTNIQDGKGYNPALSFYLEQYFAHKQMIIFNFKTSFYTGHTSSGYLEQDINNTILNDINTYIKDRNQAYGIKANYIKNWDKSRLTIGGSFTAKRNRSTYVDLDNSVFHQRQNMTYFFGEYFQRVKYVTLTAGIGADYSNYKFKETGKGNNSWNVSPHFTATYKPNSVSQFRLNFSTWQNTPNLSQTNETPQQIDAIQWSIGNPNLSTQFSYNIATKYSFTLPIISGSFGAEGYFIDNVITPYMYWEGDRLINSYENGKGFRQFTLWFAPEVTVIPHWLYLQGSVTYCAENSRGGNYSIYNHNWSGNVQATVSHYGCMLSVMYKRAQRQLYGESIIWGEDCTSIDFGYNWKKWQFGAGCFMPFGKYDQGNICYNKYNKKEFHLKPDSRFFYIKVAYNLQWGKQKKGVNKMINANAQTDASSAASR